MRKIFYALFLLSSIVFAQSPPVTIDTSLSPNGQLENIYDHYGNSYKLSDIIVGKEIRDGNGQLMRATNPTPMTCGYYNLYFEDGCGMENASNTTHLQRRAVLCQVFSDLSSFINSPLTGNNKVNIWVRNINNVITPPNSSVGVLGLASAFYNMPYNTTAGFGGIADNEIWKTIHRGIDSYTNVVSPLSIQGISAGPSGVFYHGMVAFNFTDTTSPITWNTNLSSTTAFPNDYDLYSVVLHEVTHALGFASLIGSNGSSKFGPGYNYYSRYDRFLKTSTTVAPTNVFLLTSTACSNMYNYVYNTALNSTTLAPTPNSPCSSNTTVCAKAIRYVGTSTVPVFTPNCFMPASSLSHFEDMCVSPNVNDAFFVMSDAIGKNVRKRFLKAQERNTLGDLGYSVNTSYGVSTTYQGTTTYTGVLSGIPIAGINDGINTDGTFKYIGNVSTGIVINSSTDTTKRILSNDTSASTNFECLQDVFDTTATFSVTSGVSTTNVTFTSTVAGMHLLRYVPRNSAGTQKGNITYIYVYINEANNCGVPTACNLITNGGFEQHITTLPTFANLDNLSQACNWTKANLSGTADYFNSDYSPTDLKVPCNTLGYESDNIVNNHGYAGTIIHGTSSSFYSEAIKTNLATQLLPNKNYQLSYDVSLAEGGSVSVAKLQAYLSTTFTTYPGFGAIPVSNPNMLFTNSTYSTNYNGWEKIVFNFTTGANPLENTLYIGGITAQVNLLTTKAPPGTGGCNYRDDSFQGYAYYFIDNVKLIPIDGTFILPTTLCGYSQFLPDLNVYLNGLPTNGVFSGTGVSQNGPNLYSLNELLDMSPGVYTITYTYTNASGCLVSIYSNITVETPISASISGSNSAYTTAGNNTTTNTTIIPAGYTALWTITGGSGTITTANNLASVGAMWTQLPGEITLTLTSGSGCTYTTTQTIYSSFQCNCLSTQYFTYTTSGLTVNFTAQNSVPSCNGNYSYKFLFGDGGIMWGSSQTFSHTYPAAGTYTMTMQPCIGNGYDGCFCYAPNYSQTATLNSGVKPKQSIISSSAFEDVVISPNPTTSNLNISFNLKASEQVYVVVRSTEGKELMKSNWFLDKGEQSVNFDLPSSISDGTVFVEVSYRDYKVTKTIVVKK